MYRILLSVVLLWVAFVPVSAQVDGEGPPTPYRLTDESFFQEGCFGLCMCPILLLPLEGGFILDPVGFDGLFWNFEVRNINWRFRGKQSKVEHITGTGTYRVGGEFIVEHQLSLDLQISDEAPQHFDSGLVIGGGDFPEIDIVVSVGGMVCFDRVIAFHAWPVPSRNVPKLDRRIPYEKPRDFGTIQ